jgi:hypothetical protein
MKYHQLLIGFGFILSLTASASAAADPPPEGNTTVRNNNVCFDCSRRINSPGAKRVCVAENSPEIRNHRRHCRVL